MRIAARLLLATWSLRAPHGTKAGKGLSTYISMATCALSEIVLAHVTQSECTLLCITFWPKFDMYNVSLIIIVDSHAYYRKHGI